MNQSSAEIVFANKLPTSQEQRMAQLEQQINELLARVEKLEKKPKTK